MKNASIIISSLALLGVLILFGLYFSHNKTSAGNAAVLNTSTTTTTATAGRIAYVNIDSLEANYEYLKNKKEELKNRQDAMEAELQRSFQQMQNDAAEVQRKADANTLTQAEINAAKTRLGQMQQTLEARKQTLTEQLVKQQDDFNKEIKNRLDNFLADYNKDKKFDYILSYGEGGSILYANHALNITNDVIKGMNESTKNDTLGAKNK